MLSIKKEKAIMIIMACVIALLLLLPAVKMATPSYHVIIKDTSAQFYRAKRIVIIGNSCICWKESLSYPSRNMVPAGIDGSFGLSIISMKDIAFIEIMVDVELIKEEKGIGNNYGTYLINASGHRGYLTLAFTKDGVAYGAVRFPNWAKGVYEPLKGVRISGNDVIFVRSVLTLGEMKRIGSPSYFKQEYAGQFSNNGKFIKGFYVKDGSKFSWDAEKIR